MLPILPTPSDIMCGVPTPDELAAQAEAVRRVSVARLRKDEATAEWDAAILAAVDSGAAIGDIAAAAGITRQWVSKKNRRR